MYITHLPQFGSELGWGDFKVQHKAQSPEEGFVNVVDEVGGEDDDAGESLNVVQQHSHIHIRIAVCRGAVYGREEEGERRREVEREKEGERVGREGREEGGREGKGGGKEGREEGEGGREGREKDPEEWKEGRKEGRKEGNLREKEVSE